MMPTRSGSFRLFRFAGIDVFLHWSWFLVAFYEIQIRQGNYSSPLWNALEYLALFVIVTLHEFGHSLACRQVGGKANQIVLWPLGGVAYVDPPQRPGATLWSIAAGPLVNVVLFPILFLLVLLAQASGWKTSLPDAYSLLRAVLFINTVLLVFNLLPIYPLDGGQILRSLLWFGLGRGRSLKVTTIIGFFGVAGLILIAIVIQSLWIGIMAAFILLNCWSGLRAARVMSQMENAPRRVGFECPSCHASPMVGAFWGCGKCRKAFDTFETHAVCPHCGTQFNATRCLDCGAIHPLDAWIVPTDVPPKL
jgi:Zn-dependent protease